MNYLKQFNLNEKYYSSNIYKDYKLKLDLIYNNFGKCPDNNKLQADINETYEKLDLICKGTKNNMHLSIEKPKYLNLYNEYELLNTKIQNIVKDIHDILSNKVIDKSKLETYKKEYDEILSKINNIDQIFNIQYNKNNLIQNNIIKLQNSLSEIYVNRKNTYSNIIPLKK